MDNYSALGYVLEAMKNLDYTKEQIKEMEGEMRYLFDVKTIEEARDYYDCKH